ncbi:hypothetical protein B0181_03740 [Moraxella caviae]|uniref:Uncharacterized protein n=1 Tax=Moraxella caviae TaxID=34060 RepID=A0A1T0A5P0_9GAMM|nr:hypothetical protein [Moraxella caviae]OOR91056.1 hypothetical protein B0181_03740 [Moraxella caviae]STZ14252.1 Uncharacterised protein [Moraxella caviae]VEW13123.1 Uncharacterised protein [Moraxella caviae]
MTARTFVLQDLLCDDSLPWRVHNVKLEKIICEKDLPMMFLAHYDRLPDDIKAQKPLDLPMLKIMNEKVSAAQACQILGLPQGAIAPALHVKISGTTVIVCDSLPLALHLQFTNTAKDSQACHQDAQTALENEARRFLFAGNVHVLHKNPKIRLHSTDLSEHSFTVEPQAGYTRLPNSHALATTHTLNTLKDTTPNALKFLQDAIVDKVMASFFGE